MIHTLQALDLPENPGFCAADLALSVAKTLTRADIHLCLLGAPDFGE